MFKKIFKLFAVVLVVLFGVLLYNTITLNSAIVPHKTVEIPANKDSSAIHLSQAIQIKTVSFGDTLPIDTTEFLKFRKFLETSYPLVHSKLTRQVFNEFSYVYKWVGKDTAKAPYVLMGHTDVVPVEAASESKWSVPSFSGAIKNDLTNHDRFASITSSDRHHDCRHFADRSACRTSLLGRTAKRGRLT